MLRKTTQLNTNTKNQLLDLKRSLGLKNESQTVSYLICMFGQRFPRMTLTEHQTCIESMYEMEDQQSI